MPANTASFFDPMTLTIVMRERKMSPNCYIPAQVKQKTQKIIFLSKHCTPKNKPFLHKTLGLRVRRISNKTLSFLRQEIHLTPRSLKELKVLI